MISTDNLILRGSTATAPRGSWCNLCGARLWGRWASPLSLAPAPLASMTGTHRVEWFEPSGRTSVWSLCTACYHRHIACASCGEQIDKQALMLEGETAIYCGRCFNGRPRCDTCGRPAGASQLPEADGRALCERCRSTAVSDPQHAYALYKRVRSTLQRTLRMSLREPCQLRLVTRKQLAALVERSALHSLDAGARGRCFGLFVREGSHRSIFVEYGLPQIVLLEVLAHEFAHAWQSEHAHLDSPAEVQEGFAEWAAYKLLQSWGCGKRSERMLRRDDLYGRGLHLMLNWEREGGQAEVFRRVTHN